MVNNNETVDFTPQPASSMSQSSEKVIEQHSASYSTKPDASTYSHVHTQMQQRKALGESAEVHEDSPVQLGRGVDVSLDSGIESKGVDQNATKLVTVKIPVNTDELKLNIDEDPRPVEWMMFNIFNDFLQPSTRLSVTEAAKCFDAILPDNRPDTPDDPCDKRERPQNWLWMFAELIWNLAKQIPHDHDGQDKIISLLEALDHLPFTQTFEDKHFWKSKLFGWEDPSRWPTSDNRPPQKPEQGMTRQQQCDVYINAMAFSARCAAIHWPHYDLIVYTLNEPLSPEFALTSCEGLEAEFTFVHIAAAAQWILHAGEWLWGQIRWGKNQRLEDTRRSLPPAQWVVWMRGYYSLDIKDDQCHFWANVLARKMEEIMVAHGYTADVMTNWDPKKQTRHDGLWADARYAHLFKVPRPDSEQEPRQTGDDPSHSEEGPEVL